MHSCNTQDLYALLFVGRNADIVNSLVGLYATWKSFVNENIAILIVLSTYECMSIYQLLKFAYLLLDMTNKLSI